MEIKLEMDNDVIILKLIGNLVASTAERLRTQIAKLIEKRYFFVILDMGRVDFIDSSGLGACIAVNRDLSANQGLLACAALTGNVRKIFQMTRADQKILVANARQDAVYAFQDKVRAGRR